jgi:hypothetical protein
MILKILKQFVLSLVGFLNFITNKNSNVFKIFRNIVYQS